MQLVSQSFYASNRVLLLLRDLIHERTGIYYSPENFSLMVDKLSPRLLDLGFSSFLDYYYLLKYDTAATAEWQQVATAISVQETYFWREPDYLKTLVEVLVPDHFARHPAEPLRLWSAACATGEEPLSIAIALQEAGWFDRAPIELYASDFCPTAIATAQQGLYRSRSFRTLPPELRSRYFRADATGLERIDPTLHDRIQWRVANLVRATDLQQFATAHIIFCRNVFIYFSDETIRQTAESLFETLSSPGYLFVGAAESLLRLGTQFELEEINGAFVYVKTLHQPPGEEAGNGNPDPRLDRGRFSLRAENDPPTAVSQSFH